MLILGSGSPRRKEILEFFSIPFRQEVSDFDEESILFAGDIAHYAKQIAQKKAEVLIQRNPSETIVTADTVVFFEGRVFNKPKTWEEAYQMLAELSGKKHHVLTAVCVAHENSLFIDSETTHVELSHINDLHVKDYAKGIFSLDKAGGYAIQGNGSLIVKRIEGCYYNAMGLPIQTLQRLLMHVGVNLWDYLQ